MKYKIVYHYMWIRDEAGKEFVLTSEELRQIALMYIKLVDNYIEDKSGVLYYSSCLYKDKDQIIFGKQGRTIRLSLQFCDDLTAYDLDDPNHLINKMFANKTDKSVKELTEEGYFDDV